MCDNEWHADFAMGKPSIYKLHFPNVKTILLQYNIKTNSNTTLLHKKMHQKNNSYIHKTGTPVQEINPNSAPEKIPLKGSSSSSEKF